MADSLWMRLRNVAWEQFPASPASKKAIPRILENLASRKEARAMKASHDLWQALCSGGVFPAAEPCCPFLIEILAISEVSVQGEILDVLLKLASLPHDASAEPWQQRLHRSLTQHRTKIAQLRHSNDAIVADRAGRLIEML